MATKATSPAQSSAFIVPPVAKVETPIAAAVTILAAANATAGQVQDAARNAAAIIVTEGKQFASLKVSTERAKAICTLYAANLTNHWFQKCFNACVTALIVGDKVEVIRNYTVDSAGKKVFSDKPPMVTPVDADRRKALLEAVADNNAKNAGVADATLQERQVLPATEAAKVLKMEDIIKIAQAARAATGTGRTTKAKDEPATGDKVTADSMTEKAFAEKLAYHINSASLVLPVITKLVERADADEYTMQYLITALGNAGYKCNKDKALTDARREREAAAKAAVKA